MVKEEGAGKDSKKILKFLEIHDSAPGFFLWPAYWYVSAGVLVASVASGLL